MPLALRVQPQVAHLIRLIRCFSIPRIELASIVRFANLGRLSVFDKTVGSFRERERESERHSGDNAKRKIEQLNNHY